MVTQLESSQGSDEIRRNPAKSVNTKSIFLPDVIDRVNYACSTGRMLVV